MIAKKNPKFNLEKNRVAFLQLGLFIGASVILTAFTWRKPYNKAEMERDIHQVEIPVETLEKPEEIKEEKPIVNDSKDEMKQELKQDVQVDLNKDLDKKKNKDKDVKPVINPKKIDKIKIGKSDLPELGEAPKLEDFVPYPDVEAAFPGGSALRSKFIQQSVVYPEWDIQVGNEGKVYVSFIVERDGSISNVKVINSISKSLDREAMRVIKSMPKWVPGEKGGEAVRTIVRFPINFVIY